MSLWFRNVFISSKAPIKFIALLPCLFFKNVELIIVLLQRKNKIIYLMNLLIDWFRGFTEAEGCLQITSQRSGNAFEFRFSFDLHFDDLSVLEYIKNQLKIPFCCVAAKGCKFITEARKNKYWFYKS